MPQFINYRNSSDRVRQSTTINFKKCFQIKFLIMCLFLSMYFQFSCMLQYREKYQILIQALQFGVYESNRPELKQCQMKQVIISYSFEISTFLFFALPMTVITVLYALIALRLRRSALLKKSSGSFSHHQEATRGSCRTNTSRRVLKMLGNIFYT